jgi:hypothetical protein
MSNPSPRSRKVSENADIQRQAASDYEWFLRILRDELNRAVDPVAADLKELKDDFRKMQASTYDREMIDERLNRLHEQIKSNSEDLKGIHKLIGNSGRELLERVGVLAGILYTVAYIVSQIHH